MPNSSTLTHNTCAFLEQNSDWVRATLPDFGYGMIDWHAEFPGNLASQYPELRDLRDHCRATMHLGNHQCGPQKPDAVVLSCSRVGIAEVLEGDPGEAAVVSGRAGLIAADGLASLKYFLSLGPALMVVAVHDCTAKNKVCRTKKFQAPDDALGVTIPLRQLEDTPSFEGIIGRDLRFKQGVVPDADRLHCRRRALKVLANSPEVCKKIADGDLLFAEAFYEEKTGKVHYLRVYTSSDPSKMPERLGNLQRIIDSPSTDLAHLMDLHPGAKALAKFVRSNLHFCEGFTGRKDPEIVKIGCSDARTAHTTNAPFGLIEKRHKAGNSPDVGMYAELSDSMRMINAHHDLRGPLARDPDGYKRKAVLVNVAHTRCGAAGAAINAHENDGICVSEAHGDLTELAMPLHARLEACGYFDDYGPNGSKVDPHLGHAAQANAISAHLQILTDTHPEAREIQRMVIDDAAILVPAVYSLKSGETGIYPPFTAKFMQQLRKDFPQQFNF